MNCTNQPVVSTQSGVELPLTINLHVTRACNFRCVCCYATFEDAPGQPLGCRQWQRLIDELAKVPAHPSGRPRKITFSGGEPTLLPYLPELLGHCRQRGFVTSLITNGSRLAGAPEALRDLDWLGVSVDSVEPATLRRLGRQCADGQLVTPAVLSPVFAQARRGGCRIKLNTVVSRLNLHEPLGAVVAGLGVDRWKVLQMMAVAGQNDGAGEHYGVSRADFDEFVTANRTAAEAAGVTVVGEPVDAIAGSYCMVAPTGCFFDDVTGRHCYSRPILSVGAQAAFGDVHFDPQVFAARGGAYE